MAVDGGKGRLLYDGSGASRTSNFVEHVLCRLRFIIPDNADVHVDAALEQVCGALNPLGAQRRVGRILRQEFQFIF